MIELGKRAKDKITGFTGILTARHQYITGCDQYTISPDKLDKDGDIGESLMFDEGRIKVVGKGIKIKSVQAEDPGGPQMQARSVK